MKKLAQFFLPVIVCLASTSLFANTYYVSYSTGNDTYTGTTLGAPFKTITKAVAVAVAGDIIYLRGEVHFYSAKISISKSGTAANKFYLLAYPGDATRPILNFSAMAINSSNRGLDLSGNYWVFKGFDIYKAGDNGMHVSGSNNIIEFCAFYENSDTGLQFDNGASNNQIINCDSYYNIDPSEGNADGFAVKLDVGTGNSFKGCRSWQNSDDGWDGLLTSPTNPSTTYDSCWCFLNGYRKDMTASVGNGNGFKMGGNNYIHNATLRNCLSVYNRKKGFDQNNDNGSMILYNNTGYKNNPNFGLGNNDPDPGYVMVLKNNVSYLGLSSNSIRAVATQTTNSWQSPFVVTNADFISLDTSVLRGPRNTDGSLPAISFMKLVQGSDLIDGGTNVGLPYYGSAPDLGYAESNYPMPVELLSFSAAIINNKVRLSWRTATEIQNAGWDIEKYAAGTIAWQKIGFVQGKGNSAVINDYTFPDNNEITTTVQYRLKQIDKDGKYRYSNIILVHAPGKAAMKLYSYPNPAGNSTTVNFNIDHASKVNLSIYNNIGRVIKTLYNGTLPAGTHSQLVDTYDLPSGTYFLKLSTDDAVISAGFIKIQ
jgi:hypothetical protein